MGLLPQAVEVFELDCSINAEVGPRAGGQVGLVAHAAVRPLRTASRVLNDDPRVAPEIREDLPLRADRSSAQVAAAADDASSRIDHFLTKELHGKIPNP